MKVRTTVLVFVLCLGLLAGCIAPIDPNFQPTSSSDQIEPQAGEWKTWVLASGDELRPAAPPDQATTAAEIEELKTLIAQRDAVAAGAASAILAYIFPDDAQSFNDLAQAAAQSRSLAGVSFPSDVEAGLALGRAVAEKVIERAKADGSDAQWAGTVPTGPGMWSGDTVGFPLMGTWKTWVLESGSQLRLDPPPAFDSPELLAEVEAVKNFARTEQSTMTSMYWQSDDGGPVFLDWASRHIFEQKWDSNPPRAARVYALMSVASYDALVACFDTKYTYWLARPAQLDPSITPLFGTPPHPSYPSAHACNSGASAYVLAHFFPADGAAIIARAENAADSRVWAGIHYPMDRDGGLAIARGVADLVVEWANADGAEASR